MSYLEERAQEHALLMPEDAEGRIEDVYKALVIFHWSLLVDSGDLDNLLPYQRFAQFSDEEIRTDDLIQEAMAQADSFLTGETFNWQRPERFETSEEVR